MPVQQRYKFDTAPVAHPEAVVSGNKYRFTVLTDGLLRFEWAEDGKFEDRASTFAIQRKLAVPKYYVFDHGSILEIVTKRFQLFYNKKEFRAEGFRVHLRNNTASVWHFGDEIDDLGGTTRTLDWANGRVGMGHGICSQQGFGILDDSKSFLFQDDGWVDIREKGDRSDHYLFCYGHDYKHAVRAFYSVSGSQPLLPRYALGNWWTRYYPYTQDEYLQLMDHFKKEKVPLSVAVIDLYWHLVDELPEPASGWGGYNWNKKLYPEPKEFLKSLHDRGLVVTLNDHMSDGFRWWDDKYKEACKFLGRDPAKKEQIHFDSVDRKFMDAYFDIVHRDLEKQGVDFWWVDWQQGEHSRIWEIDPLWILNHFHSLDSSRDHRRPLVLSRFAGPGSQRYPLGFSGDVIMNWDSLNFQPEYTATASNIGYAWWSHDIGGHMHGYKDDECTTRWFQLGCWSPVLRLHCSNNTFNFREPWKFNKESCEAMEAALQLRHKLIPYLYTMNARSAAHDEPLIQPLYWAFPERHEAYKYRNEYFFGSQLIVAPVTKPRDRDTHLGRVDVWFPKGRFVDIFTGIVYDGDREFSLFRPLTQTPALASEGAIIPLDGTWPIPNGGPNPKVIDLLLVVGADGHFELIEDDGTGSKVDDGDFSMVDESGEEKSFENKDYVKFSTTTITYDQKTGVLEIGAATPSIPAVPAHREWNIRLISHKRHDGSSRSTNAPITCTVSDKSHAFTIEEVDNGTLIKLGAVSTREQITMTLGSSPQLDIQDAVARCWDILLSANGDYDFKENIWWTITANQSLDERVSRLRSMNLGSELLDALLEALLADERYEHYQNDAAELDGRENMMRSAIKF